MMATACVVATSQSPDPADSAQPPQSPQSPQADRATLEREAEELAQRSRSLLTELEQLETERDRQERRVRDAEQAMAASAAALASLDERLATLQEQRLARLPELKQQLVDLYKRGGRRYLPILMTAASVRDAARATRAAAALAQRDIDGINAQRTTLEALQRERRAQVEQSRLFEQQRAVAEQARIAAARAVDTRTALLSQIDERRDLTARLAGELETAGSLLQQRMTALASEPAAVRPSQAPFASARGALDWPVPGRIARAFGRPAARPDGAATRNGIDIGAAADTPVRAVHAGTVAYADPFAGFGTLVILDHGGASYSLYGYLAGLRVQRGQRVEAGQELGRVGTPPAGRPSLYFEVRVDGRPVDPVQWLKPR
jgi:septal ring factor EnvC (AmiA/AmiB activator)